jgi:sulfocyanin
MKRTFAFSTALLLALTACGGGEPAADMESGSEASEPAAETEAPATAGEPEAPAPGEMTMPDWYQYDEANNAVTLDIVSGNVPANNYWNYQGYANGEVTVVVPVGAEVTLNFTNEDPNMAHSIGVAPFTSNPPASVAPDPVFEGAITSNATSMTEGTLTGESETITFTASEAGEYSLACYIPGHAVSGMWIGFNVSDAGDAGIMGN